MLVAFAAQPGAWQEGKLLPDVRRQVFQHVVGDQLQGELQNTLYALAEQRPGGFEPEDSLLPQSHTTLNQLINASFIDFALHSRRYHVEPILTSLFQQYKNGSTPSTSTSAGFHIPIQATEREQPSWFTDASVMFPISCVRGTSEILSISPDIIPSFTFETELIIMVSSDSFAIDQRWKKLDIPINDPTPIQFHLVPWIQGFQIIEVEFYHRTSRIGYIVIETEVVANIKEPGIA